MNSRSFSWLVIFSIIITSGIIACLFFIANNQLNQPTNIILAQTALINYFDLLNNKQYSQAIIYHGSGYAGLREWNPDLPGDNYLALLKLGCEQNGWRCLKIKKVLTSEQFSPNEFSFIVQFQNNDGGLFKLGPCCGEDKNSQLAQTDFEYTVKKIGGKFSVETPPVYGP